jgi:hypothetical protein
MSEFEGDTRAVDSSQNTGSERNALSWPDWQRSVVRALRVELRDLVHHLALKDVDWPSWQIFYEQGRSPRSAVSRALERDL